MTSLASDAWNLALSCREQDNHADDESKTSSHGKPPADICLRQFCAAIGKGGATGGEHARPVNSPTCCWVEFSRSSARDHAKHEVTETMRLASAERGGLE